MWIIMPRHLENRVKITLRTLDGSQHVTCGHSFPFQLPPLCDTGKQNIAPRFEEISIASRFEKYRSLLENLLKVKIKRRYLKHVYVIQTLEIHRRLGNYRYDVMWRWNIFDKYELLPKLEYVCRRKPKIMWKIQIHKISLWFKSILN